MVVVEIRDKGINAITSLRQYMRRIKSMDITSPPHRDSNVNPGGNYPSVNYSAVNRPKPTSGHFEELHPFHSDFELVSAYQEVADAELRTPLQKHKSSRKMSVQADQIRATWGLEASTEGTIGREPTTRELITPLDRAKGIIIGQAYGDALGRPVEFMSEDQIQQKHGRVTDFLGDGSHHQPAGTITDDTNLALYLVASLLRNNGFDMDDYAEQIVTWFESMPFDIGSTTLSSIDKLRMGVDPREAGHQTVEERGEYRSAGNGSIMRCAPLAIAYPDDLDTLQEVSRQSSEITHADPRCTHGCAALNLVLASIIRGRSDPLGVALDELSSDAPDELIELLENLPDADPEELSNGGYVLDTLETALYIGLNAKHPEDALIEAVNRGDDADTVGAVTGAIVGARFGDGKRLTEYAHKPNNSFPSRWEHNIRLDLDAYRERIIPSLLELGQVASVGITCSDSIAMEAQTLAENDGQLE
jgi:ADP-ribosyl-[dinitrogen reductase] hydrolase